jgi:hypothetical protein
MENPNEFDLNDQVRRWRTQLETSPALKVEDLAELEAHLRDSIARLQTAGLAPDEAFWVARHRLGTEDSLACEFGKVNPERVWLTWAMWAVFGSLAISTLSSLASGVGMGATLVARLIASVSDLGVLARLGNQFDIQPATLENHFLGLVSVLAYGTALLGLGLWFWRLGSRNHSFLRRAGAWMQTRPIATAIGVLLLLLLNSIIGPVSVLVAAKSMLPSTFGTIAIWRSIGGLASYLAWPLLVGWLLTRKSRHLAHR